jgi:putative NADH-flavin reductase
MEKGYGVNILVRDPHKITLSHPNLRVVKGDILSTEDVAKTIDGTQAVISVFGHVKGSPAWLQTDGTRNIVIAMKAKGLKRVVSLSGVGLPFSEKDRPKFADKLIRTIMKVAVPKILNDAIRHAEVLKDSELDWTIVRGPRLTDEAESGSLQVGSVGVNTSMKLARADLAAFMLARVEDVSFIGQMPMVSNSIKPWS